jgi:hypothetical protein
MKLAVYISSLKTTLWIKSGGTVAKVNATKDRKTVYANLL